MPATLTNLPTVRLPEHRPLTIAEVAEYTATSSSTVRRWIAQGELRAVRFGKRAIRIEARDLLKMQREANPATYAHVSGGDAA
ncbi:helix-turn-helix domain-containing protein [Micrococcus terreus]|uniref:helix-turn-helix domain-containing protein n=1 Tax=Micrococcus terreus TaxID=574650 RepID=UPI0023F89D8B|nr:helix-turn-helix domain-containing protein [Micrococcus terreus]